MIMMLRSFWNFVSFSKKKMHCYILKNVADIGSVVPIDIVNGKLFLDLLKETQSKFHNC